MHKQEKKSVQFNSARKSVNASQEQAEADLLAQKHFLANEEQDSLIVRGIRLLGTKLLDLVQYNIRNRHDFVPEKQYSLLTFDKWQNSMAALFDELRAWELKNVGELQFTKAFSQVVGTMQESDFQLPTFQDYYDEQEGNQTGREPTARSNPKPTLQVEKIALATQDSFHDSDEIREQHDELREDDESPTKDQKVEIVDKVEKALDNDIVQDMWQKYEAQQLELEQQRQRELAHKRHKYKPVTDIYKEQYQVETMKHLSSKKLYNGKYDNVSSQRQSSSLSVTKSVRRTLQYDVSANEEYNLRLHQHNTKLRDYSSQKQLQTLPSQRLNLDLAPHLQRARDLDGEVTINLPEISPQKGQQALTKMNRNPSYQQYTRNGLKLQQRSSYDETVGYQQRKLPTVDQEHQYGTIKHQRQLIELRRQSLRQAKNQQGHRVKEGVAGQLAS